MWQALLRRKSWGQGRGDAYAGGHLTVVDRGGGIGTSTLQSHATVALSGEGGQRQPLFGRPDPCVCRGRMLTVRGLSLVPAQLLHGAIHEMCGTAGRYAPGAKPLVVQYQALFQEATAKGLSPEEVWPPHPKCPCARNPTLRALVEACACAWNVRAC